MNSKNPSEERISWTTPTLNFALPILQSLKQLVVSREKVADSNRIFDFIKGKFGTTRVEKKKKCDYNCFFWESDKSVDLEAESPSARLNEAFVNSNVYVSRHYQKIIHDVDKFMEDDNEESDNEESDEEELNF
jgi:hypothetical protein